MPRFVTDSRPISAQHPIAEFYREEFVKHHRCLQQQRPYYSESAITDVETALAKILGQLDPIELHIGTRMNDVFERALDLRTTVDALPFLFL